MSYTFEKWLPVEAWRVDSRFEGKSHWLKIRMVLGVWFKVIVYRFRFDLVSAAPATSQLDVLFFKSMQRRDYDELFDNITSHFRDGNIEVFQFSSSELRYKGNQFYERQTLFGLLGTLIGLLGRSLRYSKQIFEVIRVKGLIGGLWLTVILFQYIMLCDYMLSRKPKAVVVFAEMQDLDRVLSWRCQLNAISCATLQHGLYVEYLKEDTVNRHNYDPQYVTHFLAWGNVTKEIVEKYNAAIEIIACGKPLTIKEQVEVTQPFDIVVIMDQEMFANENQEMLDAVSSLSRQNNFEVAVLFHPQNEPKDYNIDRFKQLETLEGVGAASYIYHTTSYFVDLLQARKRVFRYATDKETLPFPSKYEFRDVTELDALVVNDAEAYDVDTSYYVASWGEAAVEQHVSVISSMLVSTGATLSLEKGDS